MKKLLMGVALLALSTATVNAADLAVKGRGIAPEYASTFNWTGFYIGAHAGYGWGDGRGTVGGVTAGGSIDGGFGGLQAGYNWQLGGLVLGVEIDVSAADIGLNQALFGVPVRSRLEWFGTARGRLGFAWDRALLYGTGGVAWGSQDISFTVGGVNFSDNQTHVGWTIGAGLEYAFAPNWSAKFEYLYLDFGNENYFGAVLVGGAAVDMQIHTIKVGLNYRFGGPGLVAAAY